MKGKKESAKKTLRRGTPIDIPCGISGYLVHIVDRICENGSHRLTGYLVYEDTRFRVQNAKKHARSIDSTADIETQRKYFAAAIAEEYRRKNKPTAKNKQRDETEKGLVTNALKQFLGPEFDSEYRFKLYGNICPHSWSKQTRRTYCTFFENRIVPALDARLAESGQVTDADLKSLFEEQVQRVLTSKKGTGSRPVVEQSVAREFSGAFRVYSALVRTVPEAELPELRYESDSPRKNSQSEQTKSLPYTVRNAMANRIMSVAAPDGLTCGTSLMLFGGLRPAEATAMLFGDITDCGTYATAHVCYQMKPGERAAILKTDAAYRTITLPHIFVVFYRRAVKSLLDQGFTADRIATMPFVMNSGSETGFYSSSDLSEFVRAELIRCGCDESYLTEAEQLTETEPDRDSLGHIMHDPHAYILRRDWSTRALFVCGLEKETVDYLLGHKKKTKGMPDYQSPDAQAAIAEKLERYVFADEYSLSPEVKPLILNEDGSRSSCELTAGVKLEASSEGQRVIEFTVRAGEAYDIVILDCPAGAEVLDCQTQTHPDRENDRSVRPVIGRSRNDPQSGGDKI